MMLCIFNPEHDLCLAKGRVHYVPPRSAVDFALRDAQAVMGALYPGAVCLSVYDPALPPMLRSLFSQGSPSVGLSCPEGSEGGHSLSRWQSSAPAGGVVAWGWDAVVKHELLKRGASEALLPSDEEIATIRTLQHRSTILPLQEGCCEVCSVGEMEALLRQREHWVMKAPWSGAGRGLRWVHGALTEIDRQWLAKTVAAQRCVVAEPRREVVADLALEYLETDPLEFMGYSYFRTGSGVYKENLPWSDERIEAEFGGTALMAVRRRVEAWLEAHVVPRYRGPLGVDLMVCPDGAVHVAEINFRHTMGMVAHERLKFKV
ncbi:MAG: hypothetical protein IJ745_07635 [Bacteroidales bacterium]|nr:hypothetical protein [Bacteroidales bacterium]